MIGPGVSFPFVIQFFFKNKHIYFLFFSLCCNHLFRVSGIKEAKVCFQWCKINKNTFTWSFEVPTLAADGRILSHIAFLVEVIPSLKNVISTSFCSSE